MVTEPYVFCSNCSSRRMVLVVVAAAGWLLIHLSRNSPKRKEKYSQKSSPSDLGGEEGKSSVMSIEADERTLHVDVRFGYPGPEALPALPVPVTPRSLYGQDPHISLDTSFPALRSYSRSRLQLPTTLSCLDVGPVQPCLPMGPGPGLAMDHSCPKGGAGT